MRSQLVKVESAKPIAPGVSGEKPAVSTFQVTPEKKGFQFSVYEEDLDLDAEVTISCSLSSPKPNTHSNTTSALTLRDTSICP